MVKEKVSLEDVIASIPQDVYLHYVDYRDGLEECNEDVEQCIHDGNLDALHELIIHWEDERGYYFDELREEFGDEVVDEYEDEILDVLFARDKSTPIQDLIRNTGRIIAHYNTGYEMESGSWAWGEERVAEEREAIKTFLGVTTDSLDDDIDLMVSQASYGGDLLIYFEVDMDELLKQGTHIQFSNYHVGIVNHYNGSGDVMHMAKQVCTLPLVRENIRLEKNIRYNWTYVIADMVRDWCESTEVVVHAHKSAQQ